MLLLLVDPFFVASADAQRTFGRLATNWKQVAMPSSRQVQRWASHHRTNSRPDSHKQSTPSRVSHAAQHRTQLALLCSQLCESRPPPSQSRQAIHAMREATSHQMAASSFSTARTCQAAGQLSTQKKRPPGNSRLVRSHYPPDGVK